MKRIPRIAGIYKIDFPTIGCIFTSGEYRIIDLKALFQKLKLGNGQFGHELLTNIDLFNSVAVNNNTLSWKDLTLKVEIPNGEFENLPFEMDPISVYNFSIPDASKENQYKIGRAIKNLRLKLNLSQSEIAQQIGSNKQYISRIENDKSDLEFNTLKRIFELGFNHKLFISYFKEDDFINTYSNSIFTNSFLTWIESNNSRLDLIEGIGEAIMIDFENENIKSTATLAELSYEKIISILANNKRPISFYHFPETWTIQAKYLQHKDWFNLLKLQRMLKSDSADNKISKLEIIAKKETRQALFEIG